MKVGDVVIPVSPTELIQNGQRYTHAVIVQEEPMVLVSYSIDALWVVEVGMALQVIGTAPEAVTQKANQFLQKNLLGLLIEG